MFVIEIMLIVAYLVLSTNIVPPPHTTPLLLVQWPFLFENFYSLKRYHRKKDTTRYRIPFRDGLTVEPKGGSKMSFLVKTDKDLL